MRPRIVYWNNIPAPYVVGRFNAITDRGNLDFEAWFNERREADRNWPVDEQEWRFRARYIPGRAVVGRTLHLPLAELRATRPDLLVSLYGATSFALGTIAARGLGTRTAFRTLPTFDAWIPRATWKERAKHFLFRTVDGVKVPGRAGYDVARRYGTPANRIQAVMQSIDVELYGRARQIDPATRVRRREELGLHGCTFVYIGRLWSGKGLDYLFDAYRALQRDCPDVSLLLLGDGPDEVRYRTAALDLPGIHFAGFIAPRDLPDYLSLADAMVFPTLGDPHGLVVEESFAAGLPVICTEAAGDIRRRLPDGEAGYVVPPRDAPALANHMRLLAADPALRRRFGDHGASLVTHRAHEQYAVDFESFVERIIALPRRRSPQALVARALGSALFRLPIAGAAPARHVPSRRAPRPRRRIVYWNNIPSPYMIERFDAVARRGKLDFEAWFNSRLEPGRSWDVDESRWRFPHRYLPTVNIGGNSLRLPTLPLTRPVPDLLISLYAEPTFIVGHAAVRLRGARTAFWCEVTFDRWVPRRWWKEALKPRLFARADALLTGGDDGRAYIASYGVPPKRILPLPHTIDVAHFAAGRAAALPHRDHMRAELGLRGVTFIYVGRLWWGKGLDYLLDAFGDLQRRAGYEISLLLVGDGPEEARLRARCAAEQLRNVSFVDFVQKPDLPRYYALGDVFVFPTLGDPWGLVVDEAMACSLPVISTSTAGEIHYRVEGGTNGFIVPPEDSAALLERMEQLADDPDLRSRMGAASAARIAGHTPEQWAETFERAVETILALPPARTH